MVSVVVFEFSGMRCQPLRRALCAFLFNTPSLLLHP
ncbi:acetyltransferase [Vibrio cholerae]|nr:acetyltransferase [Vibrio cholerae]MDN6987452.1 acetyltransferase [Vibrio cholerae]MDN6991115.1 acetyltransferase [Vibrio cholerae]MDN7000399.1 acetyltransferase [Vibrio cholerae]MDN7004060.1 acetyltransferase [Vibrio cholerae]